MSLPGRRNKEKKGITVYGGMRMAGGCQFLYVLAGLILLLAWGSSVIAHPSIPKRIIVSKIDRPGLDRLIKGKGSPMVMVMMASWCGPCIHELPSLIKLHERYHPKGLRIAGVSFEYNGVSLLQDILDRKHVNFPVYAASEDLLGIYKIEAIPSLFLIKGGRIVERVVGMKSEAYLEQKIIQLLE